MLVNVKRGLDLKLGGEPEPIVDPAPAVSSVALLGPDYRHLRPALATTEGERVTHGQTLFTAKERPSLAFTAPATGRVRAINRGAKRRLLSVVIDIDDDTAQWQTRYETFNPRSLDGTSSARIKEVLLACGLWTALRARPFGGLADPAITPRAIFINAMRSDPLAADPSVVLGQDTTDLEHGVALLSSLAASTFLCKSPKLAFDQGRIGDARVVEFDGPYPAGLSGTHINLLTSVSDEPDIWHIGYQDVVAIGKLLTTGILSSERIIAIGGPCAKRPRLLRTRIGANLDDLLEGEIDGRARVISGSPLSGRASDTQMHFLGRYDTQVSLLRESLVSRADSETHGDTDLNGWPTGMLSLERFEQVWPFSVPPIPMLRALLAMDVETARSLGCLGFDEEDLALCSYVCPAKYDYGKALRATLTQLHSEQ